MFALVQISGAAVIAIAVGPVTRSLFAATVDGLWLS